MEGYTVRRFVNDKEVRELTPEQKKMMALTDFKTSHVII